MSVPRIVFARQCDDLTNFTAVAAPQLSDRTGNRRSLRAASTAAALCKHKTHAAGRGDEHFNYHGVDHDEDTGSQREFVSPPADSTPAYRSVRLSRARPRTRRAAPDGGRESTLS